MPKRSSKPQRDEVQAAFDVLQRVIDQSEGGSNGHAMNGSTGKNPAAVMLGRMGGKKGGPARAEKLTAAERRAIAQKAAQARWKSRQAAK